MDQIRLKKIFVYDPLTGLWTRTLPGCKPSAGELNDNGYLTLTIDGKSYLAHRLAFIYMNGIAPPYEVDHRNLNKADNRWANLREASRAQNMRNRGASKNSSTGIKGVGLLGGKYRARIRVNNKRVELGLFNTAAEAAGAYAAAAIKHHGDFARVA